MVQPLHETWNLKIGYKLRVSFELLTPQNTYGFGSTRGSRGKSVSIARGGGFELYVVNWIGEKLFQNLSAVLNHNYIVHDH
jgi:hypothetical protein